MTIYPWIHLVVVTHEALTAALENFFKQLSGLYLKNPVVFIPFTVHLYLLQFFLQLNFPLICLETEASL